MTSSRVPDRWARFTAALAALVLLVVSPAAEDLVAWEGVVGGAGWALEGADISPRRRFTTRELFTDEDLVSAVETIASAEILPVHFDGHCMPSPDCASDGDGPCSKMTATKEAIRRLHARAPPGGLALLTRHESPRVRRAFVGYHSTEDLASHLALLEDTAEVVVARDGESGQLSTPGEEAISWLCSESNALRTSLREPVRLLGDVIAHARTEVAVRLVECLHRGQFESFTIELFDVVATRDEALLAAVHASPSLFAFRDRRAVHARLLAARADPRPPVRAAAVRGLAAFRAAGLLPVAPAAR